LSDELDRSTPPLNSLFREVILSHYKHPHNRGELADADADVAVNNPTCGDAVRLQMRVRDGVVEDLKFQGEGCSISQASISMMTDLLKGRSREDALRLADRFKAMVKGDPEAARDPELGQLRALAGVARFPVRVRCALLGWDAMQQAFDQIG
jgi:nitrogen fixation protein NifU and related proteins